MQTKQLINDYISNFYYTKDKSMLKQTFETPMYKAIKR